MMAVLVLLLLSYIRTPRNPQTALHKTVGQQKIMHSGVRYIELVLSSDSFDAVLRRGILLYHGVAVCVLGVSFRPSPKPESCELCHPKATLKH